MRKGALIWWRQIIPRNLLNIRRGMTKPVHALVSCLYSRFTSSHILHIVVVIIFEISLLTSIRPRFTYCPNLTIIIICTCSSNSDSSSAYSKSTIETLLTLYCLCTKLTFRNSLASFCRLVTVSCIALWMLLAKISIKKLSVQIVFCFDAVSFEFCVLISSCIIFVLIFEEQIIIW